MLARHTCPEIGLDIVQKEEKKDPIVRKVGKVGDRRKRGDPNPVPLQTLKINAALEDQMTRPCKEIRVISLLLIFGSGRSQSGVDASSGPHRLTAADACLTVLWPQIVLK